MMNDSNDEQRRLAREQVGSEKEQVADVLAQLRAGSYANQIRADTIQKLFTQAAEAQGNQVMLHALYWIYAVVGAVLPFALVAAFVLSLPGPRGR